MANPFKNPDLRRVYDGYLAFARDPNGPLYYNGGRYVGRHRGGLMRCAFWDGYSGAETRIYVRGTPAWAAYRAGQAYYKEDDSK